MAKELSISKFMPSSLQDADGVTIVPQQVKTPIKSAVVPNQPLKERLHASKPWKPKGRK